MLLFVVLVAAGCSNEDTPDIQNEGEAEPTGVPMQFTAAELSAAHEVAGFGSRFLQAADAMASDRNENVLVSPLSAQMMLGILANAGNEAVRTEMVELLGCADLNALNDLNGKLMKGMPVADRMAVTSCANSAWYDMGIEMMPDFEKAFSTAYGGISYQRDMTSTATVDEINRWSAAKTANMIPRIISDVAELSEAMFVSALHFNGLWSYPFSKANTTKAAFHGVEGDTEVDMMREDIEEAEYLKTDKFSAVRLPFGNKTFTATFVLPIDITIDKLLSEFCIEEYGTKWEQRGCMILLPKYSIEGSKLSLRDIFKQQMGVTELFKVGSINAFTSGMTVSDISQKSVIEVDEEGARLAAVTWTGMDTANPSNNLIEFNRPFLFFITEQQTGTCLMAGKIVKL